MPFSLLLFLVFFLLFLCSCGGLSCLLIFLSLILCFSRWNFFWSFSFYFLVEDDLVLESVSWMVIMKELCFDSRLEHCALFPCRNLSAIQKNVGKFPLQYTAP